MFRILRWWRERARQIYRFDDGRRSRKIDPMRAWSSLVLDTDLEMDRHPLDLKAEDNIVAAQAALVISSSVRRAFQVPEFDAGGLTDSECISLYVGFLSWLESQKKSTS